ncbi:MAG: hypothetical protein JWO39_767 [Gemmatimonadetes bacterium]|nr:hypothetical protein [Gemmatimonadota bacterium]
MTNPRSDVIRALAAAEPWEALLIGGILGASTFLLCALLLGARTAIAIAAVAMIVALARRIPRAAIAFAAAAALSAAWLIPSTAALVAASIAFGLALAIYARARMRSRLAAIDAPVASA